MNAFETFLSKKRREFDKQVHQKLVDAWANGYLVITDKEEAKQVRDEEWRRSKLNKAKNVSKNGLHQEASKLILFGHPFPFFLLDAVDLILSSNFNNNYIFQMDVLQTCSNVGFIENTLTWRCVRSGVVWLKK